MKQSSTTKILADDSDEYPEVTQADFDRATFRVAGKATSKEEWQQVAKLPFKKQKINITLDPDVVSFFKEKAGGRGYQTLINAALREAMNHQTLEDTLRKVLREEMHLN
ncbi:BrnA antitoxin family protein [Moraxellaceae bacterium AER2_44_116]|nr:BrnA antitoxin family protein [Moraxellaceae bacterium]TQC96811.1 BrnA antitoxin family protein [Moraxellaceae bacterium AER2_44_116]